MTSDASSTTPASADEAPEPDHDDASASVTPTTDAWGVDAVWLDAFDEEHRVADATIAKLREIIGEPPADLDETAPIVVRPGGDLSVESAEVGCEDGTTRSVGSTLPTDFPLGYHRIRTPDGRDRKLIVSPGRCWLPTGTREWGWAVQLYAARGRRSWGIGDLADLATVRELTEGQGAGYLLVNPLHATAPTPEQEPSPYLPATRRFRNPLYLRVSDVPGADRVTLDEDAGIALNEAGADGEALIDRDAVWARKRDALQRIFDARPTTGDGDDERTFRDWWWNQGQALMDWATWCAIADEQGPNWLVWPEDLRDPYGAGVRAFAEGHDRQITFHAWLQWVLDGQLRAATGGLTMIQDLPIGVAGGGADAWAWQHVLAQGASVGAPPDVFNTAGQDWGSPPLVPWRLRQAEYEPFIQAIRATMAGAGGLRVDHVMGLFRLWWVPSDGGAADGAYVRYPAEDLLDIVALESVRAEAIVVGEDLGTVEHGVRESLAEHGILSYRLLWFEDATPSRWPKTAMAAVTTHDLPTVAGLWTGADRDEAARFGTGTEEQLEEGRQGLIGHLGRLAKRSSPEQAVAAAYRRLAGAPSILLSATLDDALAVERRPNMPGAGDRPNWSIPLPVPVEELADQPGVRSLAATLSAGVAKGRPATSRPPVE